MDVFLAFVLGGIIGVYVVQIIVNIMALYFEETDNYKNKLDFIYKTFVPVIPYVKFIVVGTFNFLKVFVNNFKKIGEK